ncbi:hypothetical protein Daus18300_001899 [Diaporthe australafricana]|uniref:Uncharacterized protein n=1 Tax=Diaporthe australafricana TaxID=127596 RepID=A0ABR3XTI3_9PEZI
MDEILGRLSRMIELIRFQAIDMIEFDFPGQAMFDELSSDEEMDCYGWTHANLSKIRKTKSTQDGRLRDSQRLLLRYQALRNTGLPKSFRYIWRAWAWAWAWAWA